MRLLRLALHQFRSYAALTWQPQARLVVLFGANGSGKTNLLEAVSLLVPGRGLRGARLGELARRGGDGRWAVAGRFVTPAGETEISTGTPEEGPAERRVFRLDGAPVRSQGEIAARLSAVWLTPAMDRLFAEGAGARRRFLDRLVLALEPAHARAVAAQDTALSERHALLARDRPEPAWLDAVEDSIARHAVAVTAARVSLLARLNAALAAVAAGAFPPARATLSGAIAERLAAYPALAVEEWLRAALAGDRARDAAAGGTRLSAQRADLVVTDAATGLAAADASTGQQKALLIGIILGHAALLAATRGESPLLLLDEAAVHLDVSRRSALFAALAGLDAPVLLTGTDRETFLPLSGLAEGLAIGDGRLQPDADFPTPP